MIRKLTAIKNIHFKGCSIYLIRQEIENIRKFLQNC